MDFLKRILAEAGIYYYFAHSDGTHTMMLCDQQSELPSLNNAIGFRDSQTAATISNWRPGMRLTSGQVATNAYDFTAPANALLTTLNNPSAPAESAPLTDYQYGGFTNLQDGGNLAKRLLAIDLWQSNVIDGRSNVLQFTAGVQFNFSRDNSAYLLLNIEHQAHDHTHLPEKALGKTPARDYQNSFTCLAGNNPYTPELPETRPTFSYHHGVVVAANNQELDTDTYGQVNVQMLWERMPGKPEIIVQMARMSQSLAGGNWGTQFIPRVGQEVLVTHLNGDLTQPIVVAALYNDDTQPLFNLPAQQNQSGIKTHSLNSKDPTTGNALIFDDTQGAEVFAVHAQKDFNALIQNNLTHTVNGGETVHIQGDQLMQLLSGTANITANEAHFIVGGSTLVMDAGGISAKVSGGQVQLLAKGAPTVMANGMPIARVNDPAHCRSGTDTISTGVNSIMINGQPVARLNDQTAHGGVIIAASPNVLAGETPGTVPVMLPASPLLGTTGTPPGPHWIQGKYTNSDGTPMSGMPYTISHSDGTTVTGTLDGSGQTEKVQGLAPGTSTIKFGDIDALNAQLAQQRAALQNSLNSILAAAKAQAAKDQAQLANQNGLEKTGTYAWTFIKNTGETIGSWFQEIAQVQQLQSQGQYDTLSGNTQDLAQVDQQMVDLGNQMYGPVVDGVQLMQVLYEDPETRQILLQFGEDYYHAESGLMIDRQVATIAGGIIPAIIVGVITGNPGILAADTAEAAGGALASTANIAKEEATTIHAIQDCTEFPGADVDKEHVVTKPNQQKYLAEGNQQPLNYDLSNWANYGLPPDGRFSRTVTKTQAYKLIDGEKVDFGGRPVNGYPNGAGFVGSASEQDSLVTSTDYKDAINLNYEPDFILEFQLKDPASLQNLLQFDDPQFVAGGKTASGYSEFNFPGISSDDIINWKLRPLKPLN